MSDPVSVFKIEREGGTAFRRTKWGADELRRIWEKKYDSEVSVDPAKVTAEIIEPVYGDRSERIMEHWREVMES